MPPPHAVQDDAAPPDDIGAAGSMPPGGEPRYAARLFGAFAMVAPDGGDALPASRKARALLAYVVLADGEDIPRERLAGLLWSERGDDQARASLRQTLYELRALGAGASPLLLMSRSAVRIARLRLSDDFEALRRARADGDAPAAAQAVGERPRELLADLSGLDPAFDEWLAGERTRRADQRRTACLSIAERALEAGDSAGALRLAGALLAWDATDEAAARLAMAASHRHGDRDLLRQTWTRLGKSLQELGVVPSAASAALYARLMSAETAPATAPPPSIPASPRQASATTPPPAAPARTGVPPRDGRRRLHIGVAAAFLAVVVVGALAGGTWLARGARAADPASARRVIAVEPLAAAAQDAAALALASGFSAELSRMIVGNAASLAIVDVAPAAAASLPGTAEADFFVTGDAHGDGTTLRADVRLRGRGDPAILWSTASSRPVAELDALREQLAVRVAAVSGCALAGRGRLPDSIGRETLRLYLGACDEIHEDTGGAAKLLTLVVQAEPRLAHAWAMLAWADAKLSGELPVSEADPMTRQADAAAGRALALDAAQGDAYVARAMLLRGIAHWDDRMALLATARAADPGNARVEGALAAQLALVGRTREAIADARASVDADPFDPAAVARLAELLGFSGDSNESGDLLSMAARRFPDDSGAAVSHFRLASLEGDPRIALRVLADPERGFDLGPKAELAMTTLLLARSDPTPAHLAAATQGILQDARRNPIIGLHAFQRLGVLDQVDAAYAYGATLPAGGAEDASDVLFSNFMAPVRADPRFMAFAARQGLVRIWLRTGRWPDFCADGTVPYDCPAEARKAARQSPALASK